MRERGVSEERVWQPWRMRANAGARIYSCGYCQWQVYQDSATCKECGKPIDWTHPRDLPFPCEEANTTTEIQVFQKWARGKRELSPYFVCDSDIETVVRRMLAEQGWCKVTVSSGTVTHDAITHLIGPLERTPLEVNGPEVTATDDECEKCAVGSYDDGMHAGKLLMAAEMEKVVKRELGDESDPADRARDIPEPSPGGDQGFRQLIGYARYFRKDHGCNGPECSDCRGSERVITDAQAEHDRLKRIEAAARRVEDEYDLPDLPECVEQLFEVLRAK